MIKRFLKYDLKSVSISAKCLMILLFVISFSNIDGQSIVENDQPIVGRQSPNFVLRNIKYYSVSQATNKDFRGKWLVLDFWNKYCGGCVASFPKVSKLQDEFSDKVQFIMVGIQDPENQIEQLFAKYKSKENLSMPCAFDSLLAKRWNIFTAPHIIIIDDKGLVRGITYALYNDQLRTFLAGGNPELAPNLFETVDPRVSFDAGQPFLMDGNGGTDSVFLMRSVLSQVDIYKQIQYLPVTLNESLKDGKFQALGAPLYFLFNFAYFGVARPGGFFGDSGYGKYQSFPILELKDSSKFRYNRNEGYYAYSLIMPSENLSIHRLQEIMQSDLQHYFGYHAKIEIRKCNCWKLIASKRARRRLQSREGMMEYHTTDSGFVAKNWPMNNLFSRIYSKFQEQVFFNETGIKGKIDIDIPNDVWLSIEDVRKVLKPNGLDLVPCTKKMKVLVIKDKSM